MKRLDFTESEILTPGDLAAVGLYAQNGMDAVTGGAIGWPAHWSRITVAKKVGSAPVVTVSPGELHNAAEIYGNTDAIDVDLQVYKPIAATDEHWVALLLRPRTNTTPQNRAIETGEEPLRESVPVQTSVPKLIERMFTITVQQGTPQPAPALRPVVADSDCCIAFVRLTTAGVQEIVANEPDRVKTVYEIESRTVALEVQMVKVIQDTTTIATNLAALGSDVSALALRVPRRELIEQFSRDIARHNQFLNVPDEARNYWFDDALVTDFWDYKDLSSAFRIREGIRFQWQNQRDAQLRLLNPDSADIRTHGNTLVLPAWSEVVRLQNGIGSGRKDISNTVHTVTTATQHQRQRTSISYGPTITVCENMAGWDAANLKSRQAQQVFAANGQTFQYVEYRGNESFDAHQVHAVRQMITRTTTENYVTYNTETFGLNGAIYAETFLCSQIMIATSVDLYFTRVGSTGDVLLCLCEVTDSGAPDFSAVIARVNKPRGQLVANGWNKFEIPPTLLEQGVRYAWFTVTTGNHQLATTDGNAFPGGSLFVCTDGAFAQGSITEDFSFRLNAARFAASRTVIPIESAQLEGGMTEFTLLFGSLKPAGTVIALEIKTEGTEDWVTVDPRSDNPLTNLPALVQMRFVLLGTEDIAPAIQMDTFARLLTGRMRNSMQAVSKEITLGFSTSQAQVVVNMDAFDAAHHTCVPKLVIGGSVISPSSVTAVRDRAKPTRTKFTANFQLGAAASALKVRLDATTDTVVSVPFGQDIQLNAF